MLAACSTRRRASVALLLDQFVAYQLSLILAMKTHLLTLAFMTVPFVVGRGPFLQQTSNVTWVLGNDIWNITQGPIYATKLFYQGEDAIGSAAGHYVGAGNDCSSVLDEHHSDMLQTERII